jgi:RNA polymerase sigma-70 factor, ECF subfamily
MRIQLAAGERSSRRKPVRPDGEGGSLSREKGSFIPSFELLFAEHKDLVYRVALRFLGSPEDAEDATQEVFTKVWKNLDAFHQESSHKTWIYRIAVNTAIDHRRKPWKRINQQSAGTAESIANDLAIPQFVNHENAERRLLAGEKAAQVGKAIARLRPHLKDVFVLKEVEEMSYEEISSALGLSLGTISSRLNRAKKALQESLGRLVHGPTLAGAGA